MVNGSLKQRQSKLFIGIAVQLLVRVQKLLFADGLLQAMGPSA